MRNVLLQLASLLAVVALAACTADMPTASSSLSPSDEIASKQGSPLPFVAKITGTVQVGVGPEDCPEGTVPAAVVAGGGDALHLGEFTIVSQTACLGPSGGTQGEFTWEADNGDELMGTYTFTSTGPDDSGVVTVTSIDATINGGTGRFAAATGSLSLDEGFFQLTSPTTFDFRITLDGTITYDASNIAGS